MQRAMALILPGRVVSARAAKKWGMVNEAVPPRDAERLAGRVCALLSAVIGLNHHQIVCTTHEFNVVVAETL